MRVQSALPTLTKAYGPQRDFISNNSVISSSLPAAQPRQSAPVETIGARICTWYSSRLKTSGARPFEGDSARPTERESPFTLGYHAFSRRNSQLCRGPHRTAVPKGEDTDSARASTVQNTAKCKRGGLTPATLQGQHPSIVQCRAGHVAACSTGRSGCSGGRAGTSARPGSSATQLNRGGCTIRRGGSSCSTTRQTCAVRGQESSAGPDTQR